MFNEGFEKIAISGGLAALVRTKRLLQSGRIGEGVKHLTDSATAGGKAMKQNWRQAIGKGQSQQYLRGQQELSRTAKNSVKGLKPMANPTAPSAPVAAAAPGFFNRAKTWAGKNKAPLAVGAGAGVIGANMMSSDNPPPRNPY